METTMKKLIPLLLLTLILTGCQSAIFTLLYGLKGNDRPPPHDIIGKDKGELRVVVVPRSFYSNAYELQNAPREIARHVYSILEDPNITKNKKLKVVEQEKVEAWLDNCNNDFDSFVEVGRDKNIKADIVIGFDIIGLQVRDPQNPSLVQGRCQVQVQAIECATGKVLASETLMIVEPRNVPISGGPSLEPQFRRLFIQVVAKRIAALFHPHDPNKIQSIEADYLEMHRL
jgi:hypothetical protein